MGASTVDFGAIAPEYDRLRPPDRLWRELLDVLVREGDLRGRRVLDACCGTGAVAAALAAEGCKVWGVDASPEMLEQATARRVGGAGFRLGRVEALPFRDGWFERAVVRLGVHLLDRPAAFAELRRVLAPTGRLVIATFDPAHFDAFWLNGVLPQLAEIDRARFPSAGALEAQLAAAGFAPVRLLRLSQARTTTKADALERLRGRYISTLRLLPDADVDEGVARAEASLPDVIEVRLEWLVAVAERP